MSVNIEVIREVFKENYTQGSMYIDGKFFAYTLEDTDRHIEDGGTKIYSKTAIPLGTYNVVITKSNRFKRNLPELMNVPQFTAIRIHGGNTEANTEGCILIGEELTSTGIRKCADVVNKLVQLLDGQEACITIDRANNE